MKSFLPVFPPRRAASDASASASPRAAFFTLSLASMFGAWSHRAAAQSNAEATPNPAHHVHRHTSAATSAASSVALSATSATSSSDESALLDADDARHLLIRTGFAPASADLAPYVGLTRAQAVDHVLASARTEAVTPLPAWCAEPLPTRAERRAWTPDQRRDAQRTRGQHDDELRAWWMREMLVTPSPLTERMTLFWHNHFTSGQDKVPEPQMMAQQNSLLRRHALGSFATLLHEVAKDPAMLLYLDGASNRKGKPNENFAREVMELFTLGEGQYTQQDVAEAARAYTGWGVDPDTGRFVWRPAQHDDGVKTVLGHSGTFDGDAMLDILLGEPQTAQFVTAKLWREFISDTPDAAQLDNAAARFRASHYDISAALRTLLLAPAFWDERNRGVLVSSPVEFVVGTVRRFNVSYGETAPFARASAALGERLFYPPNVKGWPGGAAWINSTTLLARKQFVEQLFRATESARPRMANSMTKTAASLPASAPIDGSVKAPPRAQGGMRFDLDGWLARYGLTASEKPDLSQQLQMQHAVLPLAPVDAIAAGSSAQAYLQALLMDPVYQLK
ncbi:conserved hypothetical protein [Paraburkholderia tropica]|uniref:DUF1800 domain-containing protein n=1 Tax=Paraburkholderia tropica TaxID=92647 RepID=UPI001CB1FC31|nr:DUF1800 domain-containing protein [Paraburkholderia tropica]CAG9196890.1 conserved hypothetical protein [Paraburkholderia tropica]